MTTIPPSGQGGYGRLITHSGSTGGSRRARSIVPAGRPGQKPDASESIQRALRRSGSEERDSSQRADRQSRKDGSFFYRQSNELPYRQRQAAELYHENQEQAEIEREPSEWVPRIDLHA